MRKLRLAKITSAILALCIFAIAPPYAGAEEADTVRPQYTKPNDPDWLITEICSDTLGDPADDLRNINPHYNGNGDLYEFIEICNNSGRRLNVYDYCMTYNGSAVTSSSFEHNVTEITRFLPGKNWTEGWNPATFWLGDAKMPVNPDYEDGYIEPGECFVAWSYYIDSQQHNATVEQFRAFWQVPDDVKIICYDGNSSTSTKAIKTVNGNTVIPKGHEKNFNIKNSGVGTYGIALYDPSLDGANDNVSLDQSYLRSEFMISWAVMDYGNALTADNGFTANVNMTVNFKYSLSPTLTGYKDANGKRSEFAFVSPYREASVGWLTDEQISSLPEYRISLETGERVVLPEDPARIYYYIDNGEQTDVALSGSYYYAKVSGVHSIKAVRDLGFFTLEGASVSLNNSPAIRFGASLSKKAVNDILSADGVSRIELGVIVAAAASARKTENFTEETLKVQGQTYTVGSLCSADKTCTRELTAFTETYLDGIASFCEEYSARGFIDIFFDDGAVQRFYSEFDEDAHSRSAYTVALASYALGEEKAYTYIENCLFLQIDGSGRLALSTMPELLAKTSVKDFTKVNFSHTLSNDSIGYSIIEVDSAISPTLIFVNGVLAAEKKDGTYICHSEIVSISEPSPNTLCVLRGTGSVLDRIEANETKADQFGIECLTGIEINHTSLALYHNIEYKDTVRYDMFRGACSDGRYLYYVIGRDGSELSTVIKHDMQEKKDVLQIYGVSIGAADAITYNAKTRRIIVVSGDTVYSLDSQTLETVKMSKLPFKASSCAYIVTEDAYLLTKADGTGASKCDSDFEKHTDLTSANTHMSVYGSIASLNYIVRAHSAGNASSHRNYISLTLADGTSLKGYISLKNETSYDLSLRNILFIDGELYLAYYHVGYGFKLYKADITN